MNAKFVEYLKKFKNMSLKVDDLKTGRYYIVTYLSGDWMIFKFKSKASNGNMLKVYKYLTTDEDYNEDDEIFIGISGSTIKLATEEEITRLENYK